MKLDSSHVPALMDDVDAAAAELKAAMERTAAGWTRAPAGKWSAGQHVEHLVKSMEEPLERLRRAAAELKRGSLGPRPHRGLIQALVMRLLMREPFPKGGKAAPFAVPGPTPAREALFARFDQARAGVRALALELSPEERERIWIINPFQEKRRWHYRLYELLRIQAGHIRHHMRLAVATAKE
jgi:DinB family protein